MIFIFTNTLKAPYFWYLTCTTLKQFSDIVVVAKRVKRALREGNIKDMRASPVIVEGYN